LTSAVATNRRQSPRGVCAIIPANTTPAGDAKAAIAGHYFGGDQLDAWSRGAAAAGLLADVATLGEAGVETKAAQAAKEVASKDILYHYTTEEGMNGILESEQINPSLKAANPKDARMGNGQYLTDIQPGTQSNKDLGRLFKVYPNPHLFTNYVSIDVSGLNVIQNEEKPYIFMIPNEAPLDIGNRIIGSGAN